MDFMFFYNIYITFTALYISHPDICYTTYCHSSSAHLPYLLFWYQVFTWVSVRFNLAASSIRSCTLRYFWRSKFDSKVLSWWSVNAVLAFLDFLHFMPREPGESPLLSASKPRLSSSPPLPSSPSLHPENEKSNF